MYQSLDAGFQFYECSVISHARNFSREPGGGRKALLDCFPWIWQKLFVSERDPLAFAIEFEDLHLHCVPNLEKLGRILEASPGHISDMQQTVDGAEIDERAIVGQILNLGFHDNVFFYVVECLIFSTSIALLEHGLAREHHVRSLSIQLNYLGFNLLVSQRIQIANRAHIDLRSRQKRRDAIDVDAQAPFDALNDSSFDYRAIVVSFFEIVPRAQTNSISAPNRRIAFAGLHVLDEHIDLVATLAGNLPIFHEFVGIDDAFRLIAKMHNHAALGNADDGATDNFAFLKRRLLLLKLIQKPAEILARRTRFLFVLALTGNSSGGPFRSWSSYTRLRRSRFCSHGVWRIVLLGFAFVGYGFFSGHANSYSELTLARLK